MSDTRQIQVLIYEEHQYFVIQGLELDICAWAKTAKRARENFITLYNIEKTYREKQGGSIDDIGPAPDFFFEQAHKTKFSMPELEAA